MEEVQVNVRMPKELHDKLLVRSIKRVHGKRLTITQQVTDAIKMYLGRNK